MKNSVIQLNPFKAILIAGKKLIYLRTSYKWRHELRRMLGIRKQDDIDPATQKPYDESITYPVQTPVRIKVMPTGRYSPHQGVAERARRLRRRLRGCYISSLSDEEQGWVKEFSIPISSKGVVV